MHNLPDGRPKLALRPGACAAATLRMHPRPLYGDFNAFAWAMHASDGALHRHGASSHLPQATARRERYGRAAQRWVHPYGATGLGTFTVRPGGRWTPIDH